MSDIKDHLTLVEYKGIPHHGGTCGYCGIDKPYPERRRVLCQYFTGKSYLIEPFNLCKECYEEL